MSGCYCNNWLRTSFSILDAHITDKQHTTAANDNVTVTLIKCFPLPCPRSSCRPTWTSNEAIFNLAYRTYEHGQTAGKYHHNTNTGSRKE